ncbi:ABC transporter ATP-binding protein [Thermoflexibacter ruber]|uniref:Iron(III) transport system ATP-binding protein n=1 Tax=Thermoflexibacter ruber TaxID=1003 RepID=A0A1I2J3G7_9BACT|nr:ABC transporter ATP-binding protein [Thermoflexibacter ruber]SFF48413.1 iron(III) transport system ATP-binding protein [Thermoflexibacter ruber]
MFLEVKNISKKYQQQAEKAVSNISFSVDKGEILAIVGESGSGKTSLLHIIGGLLEPDEGSIFLENERVLPPSARLVAGHPHINIVHQNFKMFPLFNVYDNISYFLRHYNIDYQNHRVSELLSLCKLEGIERKLPNELSGGQLQRVALAVALANRPKLLLLDEPFSNLDASLKLYLKKEIANILKESKTTAIIVTHDPQDAFLLADRIAVLHQGKLLQVDKPHIVYQFPINQYVAQLFGEVNLFDNGTAELFQLTHKQSSIMIRPHDVLIGNKKTLNAVEAAIKTIDFMGAFYRLEVVLPNDKAFIIYTSFTDAQVNEKICVQIDKQKLLIF